MILHLSNTYIRQDNRILKEINSLNDSGFKCHSFGIERDTETLKDAEMLLNKNHLTFIIKALNIKWLPRSIKYFLALLELTYRFYVTGKNNEYKLIHCHDTFVLPVGVLLKLKHNCKLIYDAHELESNKSGQSFILSRVTLLIEKICWSKVDHLITVSKSIEEWYFKNFKKISSDIIYNSPEKKKSLNKNYFREKFNIKSEYIFVYAGNLTDGRFIKESIEVFQSEEINSSLVILGFGKFEDYIKEEIQKYDNIHYHEPVNHKEITNVLNGSDFGICLIENISLSDYYAMPNKLFDYLFSNLQIIASKMPDIDYIVDKYNLGYTIDLDKEVLKTTVINIEKSKQKNNNKTIQFPLSYSWEGQSKKLINTYNNLI